MEVDVGLGDGRAVGRAGDDVNFMPGAAECAGEAEHVRADAAQPLLRGIFVRDQSDPHQFTQTVVIVVVGVLSAFTCAMVRGR